MNVEVKQIGLFLRKPYILEWIVIILFFDEL